MRRVRKEEWRAVRDLRLKSLASDPLAFGSTLERERAFPDDLWQERTAREATSSDSSTWVASGPSGRLIGMAAAVEVEGTPHIFGMWVEPAFRGRGVGGRLLDIALRWVRRTRPGSEVRLSVNPSQSVASALYRSRGFHPTGSFRPLGHTEGIEVQELVLPAGRRRKG